MLIGFSGKKQSGKDLSGLMVQYLMDYYANNYLHKVTIKDFNDWLRNGHSLKSKWKNVKFADKLKDITCILLDCTREQLEDDEYKNTPLGEEWNKYKFQDRLYTIDQFEMLTSNQQSYCELIVMTPRLLLQLLGTDCGRNIIHPNIWVNSTMAEYNFGMSDEQVVKMMRDWYSREGYTQERFKELDYEGYKKSKTDFYKHLETFLPDWIITDVRFPGEVEAVKEKGGIVIRLERYPEYLTEIREGSLTPQLGELVLFNPDNKAHMDFYKGQCTKEHESETALDDYKYFDEIIVNQWTRESLLLKLNEILLKHKLV